MLAAVLLLIEGAPAFSQSQPPLAAQSLPHAVPQGQPLAVQGAPLPPDAADYDRICILFDGTDQDALLRAREQWREAKEAGHAVAYWQQDESGRWQKKA